MLGMVHYFMLQNPYQNEVKGQPWSNSNQISLKDSAHFRKKFKHPCILPRRLLNNGF